MLDDGEVNGCEIEVVLVETSWFEIVELVLDTVELTLVVVLEHDEVLIVLGLPSVVVDG